MSARAGARLAARRDRDGPGYGHRAPDVLASCEGGKPSACRNIVKKAGALAYPGSAATTFSGTPRPMRSIARESLSCRRQIAKLVIKAPASCSVHVHRCAVRSQGNLSWAAAKAADASLPTNPDIDVKSR